MEAAHLKILALIPARGGSKSVPRKNLLQMLGRPLLAWSIHHAQTSRYVDRVIVSTEDEEIAQVAKSWGAETPFLRPTEFAQDLSPDIDVFYHALQWLQANEDYVPDLVVHLRPTGPARRVSKIDEALEKIVNQPDADSLRSVSLAKQTPYKMWFLQDSAHMKPVIMHSAIKESHSVARQMLPEVYSQNGYVDIIRATSILEKGSMVGNHTVPFVISEDVPDLDYWDDIPKVEAALRASLDGEDYSDQLHIDPDRCPV